MLSPARPAASWRAALAQVADRLLAARDVPAAHAGEWRMKHGQNRGATGKHLNDASGLMGPGKPAKVRNREVEEVRERGSRWPDRAAPSHGRHARACMLRSGTIDQAMHAAGRDLPGGLHRRPARPDACPCRSRGCPGTRRDPDLSERQLDARRRVHAAMEALGGVNSPAGSWAWHVLGCQQSIREWAMRQGWGGRPLHVQQAQGIALAALDLLARHLGYRAGTAT